jgi:hypothetical protein
MIILYISILAGLALLLAGLLIRVYPVRLQFHNLLKHMRVNTLASGMPFKPILDFFTRNRSGYLYKLEKQIIDRAESTLTVQSLYLIKAVTFILVLLLVLLVRYTNLGVMKQAIISRPADTVNFFTGTAAADYKRNADLYMQVLKKIGQDALKQMDDDAILQKARSILPGILKNSSTDTVNEQAKVFLAAYRKTSSIPLMDTQSIIIILVSFWLPELVLISKRLLLVNLYRKEVVKLENILELLGTVQGIKTIDILKEMAKASRIYRKHLNRCVEQFKVEKEAALESVRRSIHNTRFARLVDVIRVFSLTDRKLAMQILERNRLEQEEEMLITAQEDIDAVDLVAFLSIIPVVYLLINLLLKPMLDTIFEVFKYV